MKQRNQNIWIFFCTSSQLALATATAAGVTTGAYIIVKKFLLQTNLNEATRYKRKKKRTHTHTHTHTRTHTHTHTHTPIKYLKVTPVSEQFRNGYNWNDSRDKILLC